MKPIPWPAVRFTVLFVIVVIALVFSPMWINLDDSTVVTIQAPKRIIMVMTW